jgi:predicted nuclease with TOPRIM domain
MDSIASKVMEHDARIKGVERRVKDLETEMHDLRELTKAVAVTNSNVESLHEQFAELHQDVRDLKEIPASRWEKVVVAVITGVVGVLIGAVMALVMR